MNINEELFLYDYFYILFLLEKVIDNGFLFELLTDAFMIEDDCKERIKSVLENQDLKEINSKDSFFYYCRLIQYCKNITGDNYDEILDEYIRIKGDVIKKYDSINLISNKGKATSIKQIDYYFRRGYVFAYNRLAIIELYNKNNDKALNLLEKTSRNGSLLATLLLLKYNYNVEEIYSRMLVINNNLEFNRFNEKIKEKYMIKDAYESSEMKLFFKGLKLGKYNEDKYDSTYIRLLYSKNLSATFKNKILFSNNDALFNKVCELPLDINEIKIDLDDNKLNDSIILGTNYRQIKEMVRNMNERTKNDYKVPAIITNSKYAINRTIEDLRKVFPKMNLEIVDLNQLSISSTLFDTNHFIFNYDHNKKNTLIILKINVNLQNNVVSNINKFLQMENRKEFKLDNISLSIDLSSLPIICVIDKYFYHNYETNINPIILKDEVRIQDIKNIVEEKKEINNLKKFNITKECINELKSLSMDKIDMFLEDVISNYECRNINLVFINEYKKKNSQNLTRSSIYEK